MEGKQGYASCNCKLNLSYYAFLLPILYICIRYFHEEEYHICKPYNTLRILKFNLPYLFYLFLPKILSIIFILIVKSNTRRESISSANDNIIIKNYHIAVEKGNRKKILLLIYIVSLLEALHEDIDSLLYYYEIYYYIPPEDKYIRGWLIEEKSCVIIFVPIFAYLILHTEIHRHHYLALFFGYFGTIFVNASRFFLDFSYLEDYPFHFLNMGLSLINSLSLVLIKYIMTKYVLLSPYIFLFYDGIFNIINSIILALLQYVIVINLPDQNQNMPISEENDKYFRNNFFGIIDILTGQTGKFYLYFFLTFILSFFYYIINTLILYNNSPFLIILLEAFLPFDSDIIKIIFNKEEDYITEKKSEILKRFYFQTIGYTILLFGALILNEVIIFNCFGLNKHTFKNINKRGEIDSASITSIELNNCEDTTNMDDTE